MFTFLECGLVDAIGTPVFERYSETYWGSFMTDAAPSTLIEAEKFYATPHMEGDSVS